MEQAGRGKYWKENQMENWRIIIHLKNTENLKRAKSEHRVVIMDQC